MLGTMDRKHAVFGLVSLNLRMVGETLTVHTVKTVDQYNERAVVHAGRSGGVPPSHWRTRLAHEHAAELQEASARRLASCGYTPAALLANTRARLARDRALRLGLLDEEQALTAAARERRRIADDLHDGAQQRLVVLEIGLQTVAQLVEDDPAAALPMIRRLTNEAQEALNELRGLVHGIHPPELTHFGLVEALKEIARLSTAPIRVSTHHIRRYGDVIEDAVYFTCREAIQNVLKHAPEATTITLRLAEKDGQLELEVRDDGHGVVDDAHQRGTGIASMRHRIASVGGRLTVTAASGGGTLVRGRLPVDGPAAAG